MAETYTPTPAEQDSACTMVEDGDPLTAASVRAALEKHANAIDKLEDVVFDPEILTRRTWHPTPLQNCTHTGTYAGARKYLGIRPSADGFYSFSLELDIAHGAELNQVRVYVHASEDSAQSLEVFKVDFADLVGGYLDLPECTSLGSDTTLAVESGNLEYLAVTIGGTEIVNRSTCRYYAIVEATAAGGGVQDTLWIDCRVLTEGNQIDKAAG